MKPLLLTLCLMLLSGCRPEATKPPSPWDVSRLQPPMTEAELTEAKRLLSAALNDNLPVTRTNLTETSPMRERMLAHHRHTERSEALLALRRRTVTQPPERGQVIVVAATDALLDESHRQAERIYRLCEPEMKELDRRLGLQ